MNLAVGVWSSTEPQLTLTRNLLWQSQNGKRGWFFSVRCTAQQRKPCLVQHHCCYCCYCCCCCCSACSALLCHTLSCNSQQTNVRPHTPKPVARPHGTPQVRVILRKAAKPRLLWFFFSTQTQKFTYIHTCKYIHTYIQKNTCTRTSATWAWGMTRRLYRSMCRRSQKCY